jgi:hypothetical protein
LTPAETQYRLLQSEAGLDALSDGLSIACRQLANAGFILDAPAQAKAANNNLSQICAFTDPATGVRGKVHADLRTYTSRDFFGVCVLSVRLGLDEPEVDHPDLTGNVCTVWRDTCRLWQGDKLDGELTQPRIVEHMRQVWTALREGLLSTSQTQAAALVDDLTVALAQ